VRSLIVVGHVAERRRAVDVFGRGIMVRGDGGIGREWAMIVCLKVLDWMWCMGSNLPPPGDEYGLLSSSSSHMLEKRLCSGMMERKL